MESVLQADIFFFISSIAAVSLTALIIVGGFYLIRILRNVSAITDAVHKAVADLNSKVEHLSADLRKLPWLGALFRAKNKRRKTEKE